MTDDQRRELTTSGFDVDRLRRLSRSAYGVSQIRSVLLCFTDAYPGEQPGIADVARVGEAWRLAGRGPASELRAQWERRGLGYLDPDRTPRVSTPPESPKSKPLHPRTLGRTLLGWALVLVLVVVQALLGLPDPGMGMVFGAAILTVGWLLPIRRLVYGRRVAPRSVKTAYILGTVLLCFATASTGTVALIALGVHGTVRIAEDRTGTDSHGAPYHQCYLDLPGGIEPLRTGGECPAPKGAPVSAYYMPADSPLRPVIADRATPKRLALLWGLPTALGLGLLVSAAAVSIRDLEPRVSPGPNPGPGPGPGPGEQAAPKGKRRH